MGKKTKMLLMCFSLVIIVGVVVSVAMFNNSADDNNVVQQDDNYNHEVAKTVAVEQGYVSEEVEGIEIGMAIQEVDEVLGEEGVVDYEFQNKKKVVYSATEGYQLEVIFEDEKVIGISVVQV